MTSLFFVILEWVLLVLESKWSKSLIEYSSPLVNVLKSTLITVYYYQETMGDLVPFCFHVVCIDAFPVSDLCVSLLTSSWG